MACFSASFHHPPPPFSIFSFHPYPRSVSKWYRQGGKVPAASPCPLAFRTSSARQKGPPSVPLLQPGEDTM